MAPLPPTPGPIPAPPQPPGDAVLHHLRQGGGPGGGDRQAGGHGLDGHDAEGLVAWFRRLLPGREEERGRARLSWTEPSTGPLFRRGVVLDLDDLEPGGYTLLLRTSWPGQPPLETRRGFTVR